MAHFAQIDENNTVVQVLVVNNDDLGNTAFPESELLGQTFLSNLLPGTTWKQTSYNHNFRFRYAGVGHTFYPDVGEHGGFSPPKPIENPSFVFDSTVCNWVPPIPYPTDGSDYYWDEPTLAWIKIPSFTSIG
jgi:hypothetical protein